LVIAPVWIPVAFLVWHLVRAKNLSTVSIGFLLSFLMAETVGVVVSVRVWNWFLSGFAPLPGP